MTFGLAGVAFGLTGVGALVVGALVVGVVVVGVVVVGVVVVGGGGGAGAGGVVQVGLLTVSWMKVTSALRARTLPSTVMFSVSVIWVRARIVPTNVLSVFFKKAELTFQKTLHGWAPFV